MKKALQWLDSNLELYLCVGLMSVMTLLVFLQVIMRYIFHNSLSWSEELARYIFIWLIFLGISYGCRLRKHIKIDAALLVFPKRLRKYIVVLGDVLFLIFAVYLTWAGIRYTAAQASFGKMSAALRIPFQYVYSATWVGFGLTAVRETQTIIYRIRCIKNREEFDG